MTGHPLLSRGGSRGRSGFHLHRSLSSRARAAGKGPKAARPQGLQGSWDLPVHAGDPLRRLLHRPEWAGGHGRGEEATSRDRIWRHRPRSSVLPSEPSPGARERSGVSGRRSPAPSAGPAPPASRSRACAAAPTRFPESLIDCPLLSRRPSALPLSTSARAGEPHCSPLRIFSFPSTGESPGKGADRGGLGRPGGWRPHV